MRPSWPRAMKFCHDNSHGDRKDSVTQKPTSTPTDQDFADSYDKDLRFDKAVDKVQKANQKHLAVGDKRKVAQAKYDQILQEMQFATNCWRRPRQSTRGLQTL